MKFEWVTSGRQGNTLGFFDGALAIWINPDNTYEFYSTAEIDWVEKGPLPAGLSIEEAQAYVETIWRMRSAP